MQISFLQIKNFKSIQNLTFSHMENALILVGQNSVGKSSVLAAIAAAAGQYEILPSDFNEQKQNIEISMSLIFSRQDLHLLFQNKKVSPYRRFETWFRDFKSKLPSYENGTLTFTFLAKPSGHHTISRRFSQA